MNWFRSLPTAYKLGTMVAGALAALVVMVGGVLWSEWHLLMDERKTAVRQVVEAGHAILAHHHSRVTRDKVPEAQAKADAIAEIRSLRFNGDDYMWLNDMQPKMVMHPTAPKLNGTDLSGFKDPNGKLLFVEGMRLVREQGAGFIDYEWPKPGHDKPVPKVSYMKGFAPWDWVIGAGVYFDGVNTTIRSRGLQFGAALLVLGLGSLAFGLFISRSILAELGGEPGYARSITREIAQGRLATEVQLKTGDRNSLLHDIEEMRRSVAGIVARVRQSSESVALASAEIASGNENLSARTEQQAQSLQSTVSSMQELSQAVTRNAASAREANALATSASTVAAQGGEVVAQVVDTMRDINHASQKIADITGVIDGIAFQTNILALNAAVEAARAGEQGRGFAVVAGEVRSLAQRSAQAAREIKGLIADSVARATGGSELADRAGQTMGEVVNSIREVSTIVNRIAEATDSQNAGVVQINDVIRSMDASTQQNAAMVEQIAAAAGSLSVQAKELVGTVGAFRTERA